MENISNFIRKATLLHLSYLIKQLECLFHLQNEVHGDVFVEQAHEVAVLLFAQDRLVANRRAVLQVVLHKNIIFDIKPLALIVSYT